jgi:hypothetical protein
MDFRLYLNALYFPHGHLTLLNNHPPLLKFILQLSVMASYFRETTINGIPTAVQSAAAHFHADAI